MWWDTSSHSVSLLSFACLIFLALYVHIQIKLQKTDKKHQIYLLFNIHLIHKKYFTSGNSPYCGVIIFIYFYNRISVKICLINKMNYSNASALWNTLNGDYLKLGWNFLNKIEVNPFISKFKFFFFFGNFLV